MRLITILLLILFSTTGFSQGEWEHKFVAGINPQYPTSDLWKTVSATTKPIAIAVPAGMLVVALIEKNKTKQNNALEILGSLAITTGATEILKRTIQRPRPYHTYTDIYPNKVEDSYSFPSGHTSLAFSTATSVALTSKRWYVTVPAFVWATSVGYSRMYLGQHYPSDVFVGALVGSGSAFFSHWISKKIFPKKPR